MSKLNLRFLERKVASSQDKHFKEDKVGFFFGLLKKIEKG